MREWIVAHDGTHGADAYALECTRCGTVERCDLPMGLNDWVGRMKRFSLLHRDCEEAKEKA